MLKDHLYSKSLLHLFFCIFTQVVLGYLSKLVFLHFDRPDAVSSAFALSRAPPGTSVSERLGTCRIKEKRKIIPPNQLKLPVSNFLILIFYKMNIRLIIKTNAATINKRIFFL